MKKCDTCNGNGQINETRRSVFGTFNTAVECPKCFGKGEIPEQPCPTCKGAGVNRKNEEITVRIPAGIQNGEMIRMAGDGEAAPGGIAGDLYIKIHVERDKVFTRDGANLLMTLPIKITDALLGADQPIHTLDGDLTLKIPAGVSSGELLRIKDRGVPVRGDRRGDLLVKIVIKTPNKLSKTAKKLIEDLKKEGL